MVESQPHNNPALGLSPFSGTFVGRRREMDELRTALDDTMAGRGRLIMLAGEPGIGKTRIAQELASTAEELGGQVLWGRCHEGQGRPPYWPWVQLIRSYVRNCDTERLAAELGSGAAIIAEVVPEIGEKISDLTTPSDLEPEQARFRLFDSVTGFLKNAAGARPSVLILEDLQWADTPSLLMLEFLSAELVDAPLLLLGTYRDAELPRNNPLSNTLGELARQRHFREFLLQGLSRDDVNRFMAISAGVEPFQELVKRVFLTTEGNPLFMTQIVQLLVHQGQIEPAGPISDPLRDVEIPQSVRLAIRRRLSRLSEDSLQILRLAAVIGREFSLEQLAALSEIATEEPLLEVLAEPLTDRVIEELPRSVGRYQFTHALIQDTLAQELSPTRKVHLHAMIAQTLEGLYGDDIEVHAAELAYHYAEAEAVTGHHKTAHFASLAGERALSAYANDEALAHFKQALAGKDGQAVDGETAGDLFGLARAQGATGQVDEAWVSLGPAFDFYVKDGNVAKAVAVAEYPLFYVSGLKEPTRFVSEALALVPRDSLEAGRLLSRLGLLLNLDAGDYEGANEAFARALAIAKRERDAALEMRTLAAAADAEFYRLQWSAALEKNVRVVELAQRAKDPRSEVWPHWLAAFSLLCLGRSEEAVAHTTAMQQLAEKLHNRGFLASASVLNALGAHTRGNWQAARDFYDRELSQEPGSFGFLAYRSLVEFEVGDFTQGESHLERCLEAMRQTQSGPTFEYAYSAVVVALAARITGDSDRLDVARRAGEAVVGSPSGMTFFKTMARTGLGLLAILRDDAAAAGENYTILREYQGTMSPPGPTVVDRVLGLLSQTMGVLDQAVSHFEDSLAFCRKARYRPELAWTLCDYADVLLQRNDEGDRVKAIPLLNESLAMASELGMRPLIERVAARQESMDLQQPNAPDFPDGLSTREAEVLRLVALGRTNREIGEELFISASTVARHVSNIFTKTNVSNRAEAATYASRQGLVS